MIMTFSAEDSSGRYLEHEDHISSSDRVAEITFSSTSEFGIPSIPDMRTVNYWLGDEKSRKKYGFAQSQLMAQHNKAGSHERRFAVCLNDNFRMTADLET